MELILTLIVGISGALATFIASHKLHWGAVKASSILSLSVAIIMDFIPFELVDIASVFFGGSFVGMCSNKLFQLKEVLLASVLYSLIYLTTYSQFDSIGGSLGTAACISCALTFGVTQLKLKRS